jgi:hypothetical protein
LMKVQLELKRRRVAVASQTPEGASLVAGSRCHLLKVDRNYKGDLWLVGSETGYFGKSELQCHAEAGSFATKFAARGNNCCNAA